MRPHLPRRPSTAIRQRLPRWSCRPQMKVKQMFREPLRKRLPFDPLSVSPSKGSTQGGRAMDSVRQVPQATRVRARPVCPPFPHRASRHRPAVSAQVRLRVGRTAAVPAKGLQHPVRAVLRRGMRHPLRRRIYCPRQSRIPRRLASPLPRSPSLFPVYRVRPGRFGENMTSLPTHPASHRWRTRSKPSLTGSCWRRAPTCGSINHWGF